MRPPDPERWRTIEHLIDQALEHPPAERGAFLEAACGDDDALKEDVLSWLAQLDEAEQPDFLPRPPGMDSLMQEALREADGARGKPSEETPDIQALPEGARLAGRYDIEKVLGHGGFGITYLAHDTRLMARVAVKEFFPFFNERGVYLSRHPEEHTVVPSGTQAADLFQYGLDRFLEEARALAQFDDPHILRVMDHFEANGTAYMVMRYYEGQSLEQYLAAHGNRLDEKQAVRLVLSVLDGLRVVHAKGMLHRDIKPSNIVRTDTGRVVLLDFGAARYAMTERTHRLTPIASPGYAPWEQLSGTWQGPWTDLYACGALLYRMLTGTVPRRSDAGALHPPAAVVPGVSPSLNRAVMKALELQPKDRFQTTEAFQEALRPVLRERIRDPSKTKILVGLGAGVVFALLLIVLWPDGNNIDTKHPYLEAYQATQSGLPDNDIEALAFDEQGVLWIGTLGSGLVRYDGTTWDVYTAEATNLPGNSVQTLTFDGQGALIVGTADGLARFVNGDFTVYTEAPLGNDIRTLALDSASNLWVGTQDGKLARVDNSGRVTHADAFKSTYPYFSDPSPFDNPIRGLAPDRSALDLNLDGKLWIGTSTGLIRYPALLPSFSTTFTKENSRLPNDNISSIIMDEQRILWLGTDEGLIRVKNPDSLSSLFFSFNPGPFDLNVSQYTRQGSRLPSDVVNTLAFDQQGTLWVGTRRGLARFTGTAFQDYPYPALRGDVRSIAFDARGTIWIGTRVGGLTRFDGADVQVFPGPPEQINCFVFAPRGVLWIGTDEGLIRVDSTTTNVYTPENSLLPDENIRSLALDAQGTLWIGTFNDGLAQLNGNTIKVTSKYDSNLPDDGIRSLAFDAQGTLWIGTWEGGLARLDDPTADKLTFEVYDTQNNDLLSNDIRSLTFDARGTLWMGTSRGLARLKDGAVTPFTSQDSDLPSDTVYTLAFDRRDRLWIGTERGLARLDDPTDDDPTFEIFTEATSGLPDNNIQGLAIDRRGRVWIGTNAGLARLNGKTFRTFNREQGDLPNNLIKTLAVDPHGDLWIGTAGRLAVFDGSRFIQ